MKLTKRFLGATAGAIMAASVAPAATIQFDTTFNNGLNPVNVTLDINESTGVTAGTFTDSSGTVIGNTSLLATFDTGFTGIRFTNTAKGGIIDGDLADTLGNITATDTLSSALDKIIGTTAVVLNFFTDDNSNTRTDLTLSKVTKAATVAPVTLPAAAPLLALGLGGLAALRRFKPKQG